MNDIAKGKPINDKDEKLERTFDHIQCGYSGKGDTPAPDTIRHLQSGVTRRYG